VIAIDDDGGAAALIAAGTLGDFRCGYGRLRAAGEGVVIDRASAAALGIAIDDPIAYAMRH